jgi:hypothetical protein
MLTCKDVKRKFSMGVAQKTRAVRLGLNICLGLGAGLGLGIGFNPDSSIAQSIPAHAEGLTEELVSVPLDANRQQAGVYSVRAGTSNHTRLVVLLPGYPSVVRTVVENGTMMRSKLNGSFLIRSRRILTDE